MLVSDRPAIGECAIGIVTRAARDGAIAREAAILEESPPEFDVLSRERILVRHRHIEIQTQRDRDDQRQQPDGHE